MYSTPLNKDELLEGKLILPKIKKVTPIGMNMLEEYSGYLVEDIDGDIFALSFAQYLMLDKDVRANLPDISIVDELKLAGIRLSKKGV